MTNKEFIEKVTALFDPADMFEQDSFVDSYNNSKEVLTEIEELEIMEIRKEFTKWGTPERQAQVARIREIENVALTRVCGELGAPVTVHEEGGGEGEGEHVELVIHFPLIDRYALAHASYYSHHGIDYWQEWQECKPQEVTITQYVTITDKK